MFETTSLRAGPKNVEGFANISNLNYHFKNDFINVLYFKTLVNENSEDYIKLDSFVIPKTDTKYKPHDAVNTEYELLKYGVDVKISKIKHSTHNINGRGIRLKLF